MATATTNRFCLRGWPLSRSCTRCCTQSDGSVLTTSPGSACLGHPHLMEEEAEAEAAVIGQIHTTGDRQISAGQRGECTSPWNARLYKEPGRPSTRLTYRGGKEGSAGGEGGDLQARGREVPALPAQVGLGSKHPPQSPGPSLVPRNQGPCRLFQKGPQRSGAGSTKMTRGVLAGGKQSFAYTLPAKVQVSWLSLVSTVTVLQASSCRGLGCRLHL